MTTSVRTEGQLPPPLTLDDLLRRDEVASLAEEIYDTNPNLVARLQAGRGPVVVKWFGWRHRIHYALSPTFESRAQASWTTARTLKLLGIRTPEPLYVYTRREKGTIQKNFFITDAIHPHTRLRSYLMSDAPASALNQTVEDLARSIARMHGGGVFHRDLTMGNFLVSDTGNAFIVDLNRARQLKKLSAHHRLTDLAKLNFKTRDSDTEDGLTRLFFRVYLDESRMTVSLLEGYRDYRGSLLGQRRLKKRLRRLFRGK
ncbi:MAG: lipopolysaccharide kinase InaA family protein [Fidelibacterota bacterium]